MKQKTRHAARNALPAVLLLGFLGDIQTADPIIPSVALIRASGALHFSSNITAQASSISTLTLAATNWRLAYLVQNQVVIINMVLRGVNCSFRKGNLSIHAILTRTVRPTTWDFQDSLSHSVTLPLIRR